MSDIKGIFAASISVFNKNLTLDVSRTIQHSENLINNGCHGVVIFGSTGQAQLIPVSEKIDLLNKLSNNKFKEKYLIGTGLNSLGETINIMKIAFSLGFKKFLIMPPAYYKYNDSGVINFYSKLIDKVPEVKIILYNFEKLCGYKFTVECIEELVKRFPNQIVGVKDSTYNLYENLKIKNFSIFPGSELKLLTGLKLGCSGIITATCNVTANLSRKVYEDFFKNKKQLHNENLCNIRKVFDQFNLISGLHSFLKEKDSDYSNILPTLSLLDPKDEKILFDKLRALDFPAKKNVAA